MSGVSRYREQDGMIDLPITHTLINNDCTVVNTVDVSSSCKVGVSVKTWDVVTPGYHSLVRRGEVINNPFTSTREERSNTQNGTMHYNCGAVPCGGGILRGLNRWDGPELTYRLFNGAPGVQPKRLITDDTMSRYLDLAATKCWADVAAGDEQLLVFLAEIGQTWRMLLHPLDNVHKALDKIKAKKNATKGGRSLTLGQYLSNEWLTYRFGFRPLLSDINNTLKALVGKHGNRNTSRGNQSLKDISSTTSELPRGDLRIRYQTDVRDEITIRCGVLWQAEMSTLDWLGVNASSIPSAAWELIPFSFVVDWFANVGDFIAAFTPHPLTAQLATWQMVRRKISTTITITDEYDAVGNSCFIRKASGVETDIYTETVRVPTIPLPSLTHKIDLDAAVRAVRDLRVVDSIGLILQRLRR